jgi:hypothetical protein
MLLLNTVLGFVYIKVKVLKLILKEQHIILNLLLIKNMLLLNSIMGFAFIKVKVLKLIFEEHHIFKLAADQRNAAAQFNYGNCMQKGEGVRVDFQGAAHYFKLAAAQGHANAQCSYGRCLHNREVVSIDLNKTVHAFTFVALQFLTPNRPPGFALISQSDDLSDFGSFPGMQSGIFIPKTVSEFPILLQMITYLRRRSIIFLFTFLSIMNSIHIF